MHLSFSIAILRVVVSVLRKKLAALAQYNCRPSEVAVIYPQGTLAHRKDYITRTRMFSQQKKLA